MFSYIWTVIIKCVIYIKIELGTTYWKDTANLKGNYELDRYACTKVQKSGLISHWNLTEQREGDNKSFSLDRKN